MSRILFEGDFFTPCDYASEAEFEREIVEHARAVFGDETLYIDVKKKIGQDIVTIPDGYLIDFSFPYDRDRTLLAAQFRHLAQAFGTSLDAAEHQKRRLDPIRAVVHEIDRLAWATGQVTGAESFQWTINCSDFLGDPDRFGADARAFLAEAQARPPRSPRIRLGLLGVPPICTDLFEVLAEMGAEVVFSETPRQFAMPALGADLVEQYARYTYPYDVFGRLDDVERECGLRRVEGAIHYVQSFCHRQVQDRLVRERLDLPVLTLECDRPGPLDAASRTRLEAFVELLEA